LGIGRNEIHQSGNFRNVQRQLFSVVSFFTKRVERSVWAINTNEVRSMKEIEIRANNNVIVQYFEKEKDAASRSASKHNTQGQKVRPTANQTRNKTKDVAVAY